MTVFLRRLLPILLFVTAIGTPEALEFKDPGTQRIILELEETLEPRYLPLEQAMLITHMAEKHPVRHVALRFKHENFLVDHSMIKSPSGGHFLLIPLDSLPSDLENLEYLIIEDGLYVPPPSLRFASFSPLEDQIFSVPLPKEEVFSSFPAIIESSGSRHRVRFQFTAPQGQRVYLGASFNLWRPFSSPMVEKEPGIFELDVTLGPGTHYYRFFTAGEYHPDPQNPRSGLDQEGFPASILDL